MIRPARPGDETAIRALQSLLPVADEALVPAACNGPLLGRLALAGKPIGYALAVPGEITTLAELVVAPAARREGYGRALVESIAAASAADRLRVTTPEDRGEAIAFYRALGFEIETRLPGFYDGADGLRLGRRP